MSELAKMKDSLKGVTHEYFSLAEAQQVATDTTNSFRRQFAEAAQGTGKASKAWTMFGRVLSGSPLWKMQNYIRSAGQAMDFFYSSTENAVKAANDQAESMGKLTVQLKGVEEQLVLLETAGSHAELFKNNLEYANAYSAILVATQKEEVATAAEMASAEEMANARTLSMYEKTKETLLNNQKEGGKALIKAMTAEEKARKRSETLKFLRNTKIDKKQLDHWKKQQGLRLDLQRDYEKKLIKLEKLQGTEGAKKRGALQKQIKKLDKSPVGQDVKALVGARKELAILEKANKQMKDAKKLATEKKAEVSGLGKREDFKKLITIQEDQQKKRKEFWAKNLEGAKKIWKGTEKFMTFGLGFKKIWKGLSKGFKETAKAIKNPKKAYEAAKKNFGNLRATIKKNGGVMKTLWKGIKGPMGMVWKVMKGAMMGMLYFMLFLVGAFLVFSIIKDIFKKAEVMETIMNVLSGVFDGVLTILSGVFDIFGAFFGGGTFGEKLQLLIGGIGKIFGGIGKILWSVLTGIVSLAFKVVVAYVTVVINLWLRLVKSIFSTEFWTKIGKKIGTYFSKLWNEKIGGWAGIGEKLGAFWTDKIWGPLMAWGDKLITNFLDGINPFATGGTTVGGLSLVGERGPELVKLPRGSRVHSNDTSRNMLANSGNTTNNVSVNVSGRVGASDSELRDIAKKIGRMVSTEINRTTSSSTNVRF